MDPNDDDSMGSLSVVVTPPLLAEEGLLLLVAAGPWWNTLWATCTDIGFQDLQGLFISRCHVP